jgi:hypothetical protein
MRCLDRLSRSISLDFSLPTLHALFTVSETSLNVLLFVPLAALAILVPYRGARNLALVLVWLSPLVVESIQDALPVLGRSGFLLDDVATKPIRVAIGTAIGIMVLASRALMSRPLPATGRSGGWHG